MESRSGLAFQFDYLLIGLFAISLVVIIYLLFRLNKSLQDKAVIESKYQEIEHKYSQVQLENIDSRLNPHLFKNILNSVQSHA